MHKALSVKSRVRGGFHARFCERVRVKLPRLLDPDPSFQVATDVYTDLRYNQEEWD